jgi:sugar phosphate isomerase/epimerase
MLDKDIIQHRGFHNLVENGRTVGFRIALRNPNYRGLYSSLVDGVGVTVDGHAWTHEETSVVLQGQSFRLAELRRSSEVRWNLDELAFVDVALDGGLSEGVHRVKVDVRLRAPYFPPAIQTNTYTFEAERTILGPNQSRGPKYGVSTYSYTGDMNTIMTLEDAMAEIADMGCTGIEILGEGNIPNFPTPSTQWIDEWHRLLAKYELEPTNLGSWIDTTMWLDRDLTAQEGYEALARDIRLASTLGFSFIRPKFGVVSWDLDPHPIWQEVVERALPLAVEKNVVICPEIHPPTPIKHKVVDDYISFIKRTGTEHFGLLMDTGIFMTKAAFFGLDGHEPQTEDEIPVPLRALKVPMEDLAAVMEHVVFFQAKFYDIDEKLQDPHVPWRGIFEVLKKANFTGYLSSEYEGPRDAYRGKAMVRRQHSMFRELEREIYGG